MISAIELSSCFWTTGSAALPSRPGHLPGLISEPHTTPEQTKKWDCKATNRHCSLLLSLSSGYRHGQASYPKKPHGQSCFPSTTEQMPAVTGNLLSRVMAASLEVLLQKNHKKTITRNGQNSSLHPWCSYVEPAPKSTHLKANIWLHPAGF